MLAGLISKSSGTISFCGSSSELDLLNSRKKFSFIVETPYYVPEMTAYENLNLQRIQKGIEDKACIEKALELVGLQNTGKKPARHFSLGMRQRLGIAIAMLTDVDVLILDEPINGLDPEGIIEIRELIERLNQEKGITVLICSHLLEELSKLVTDYIFVDNGSIIKQISADNLLQECEKSYTLNTSDNIQTFTLLSQWLAPENIEATSNGKIVLTGNIDIPKASQTLYNNQVLIYELFESTMSLEDYYIALINGKSWDTK